MGTGIPFARNFVCFWSRRDGRLCFTQVCFLLRLTRLVSVVSFFAIAKLFFLSSHHPRVRESHLECTSHWLEGGMLGFKLKKISVKGQSVCDALATDVHMHDVQTHVVTRRTCPGPFRDPPPQEAHQQCCPLIVAPPAPAHPDQKGP